MRREASARRYPHRVRARVYDVGFELLFTVITEDGDTYSWITREALPGFLRERGLEVVSHDEDPGPERRPDRNWLTD
jgi:hypothetical protein